MFKSVFDVWKHPMMLCIQRTQSEWLIDMLMYCVAAALLLWPFLASWQTIEQTEIFSWKAIMMIIYIFSFFFSVCGRLMNFPVRVNTLFKDLSLLQCLSLCRRERKVVVIRISPLLCAEVILPTFVIASCDQPFELQDHLFSALHWWNACKILCNSIFFIYPFLSETEGSSEVWVQRGN